MTRMTRMHLFCWSVAALLLAMGGTGCGPDPKQQKIDELTKENERLNTEKNALNQQLSDAMTHDNDSRETIDQLNRELAKLRAKPGTQATEAAGGWVAGTNFDFMSLPENVLFESGKATLSADGRKRLTTVAADIRAKYGDRDVYVFGHTDAQPIKKSKWKDNWELSAQRSLTVVRTLHELGIPYGQLISASCGEHRPIVADKAKADQPKNRRVEFFAVKKGPAGSAVSKTNVED
jgi:chemotaxis protein MotB